MIADGMYSAICPPPSVGIICASVSRKAGGILPIMQAHAKELSRLGVKVGVHGILDELSETDRASWTPAQLNVHRSWLKQFAYSPGVDRSLTDASHDVVHQHGLWLYPSIAVSRWRQRTGRPVIISTQGMLEPWAIANAAQKKRIAARLFERSNLVGAACIHCSKAEVPGIRAFGLTNPVAIIPNGADLPDCQKQWPRPSWLPNDGRKMLLFLGRIHPKKGIRETLEAWALVKSQNQRIASRWRLAVVGWDDGGHADGFIKYARALGLDDVLFPGPVYGDAKQSTLAHADAFILASHSEGLPMAVLEAWAYAIPVFMTRWCNLSESFDYGAAVEITTGGEDIAAGLINHLNSPELANVGGRGRLLVQERFSWPSIAKDLLAVYEWVLLRGARPECVLLK